MNANQLAITYGGGKTFTITTSLGFAAGATITGTTVDLRHNLTTVSPVSGFSAILPNQSTGVSSWSFDLGTISNGLVGEAITTVGFTLLSRSGFSQDAAISWFLDGSSVAAAIDTENIGNSSGGDDTFISYTAPAGSKITGFTINYGGSTSANDRRIGIDDLGFITGVVVPEPGSLALCGIGAGILLGRRRRMGC